ncbi:hypothetical protein ACU4GD_22100 [Cupriavidus basilensis]
MTALRGIGGDMGGSRGLAALLLAAMLVLAACGRPGGALDARTLAAAPSRGHGRGVEMARQWTGRAAGSGALLPSVRSSTH